MLVDLELEDLRPAGILLARAFFDDPLYQYAFPNRGERHRVLPKLMSAMVRFGMSYGSVRVSGNMRGLAIWLPPGDGVHFMGILTSWLKEFPLKANPLSLLRFLNAVVHCSSVHDRLLSSGHWYLLKVGTDPTSRGQGLGKTLISDYFAEADRTMVSCYLETFNRDTLPMYESMGFESLTRTYVSGGGPEVWAMQRKSAGGHDC